MAKVKIKKSEIDEFMKMKGNVSGTLVKSFYQYILNKSGEEGVQKVEKRMAELGYPLEMKKIFSFRWYPAGYISLICLVVLENYDMDEKEAYNIGYVTPLYAILTKLIMKYLASLDKVFTQIPRYWDKHYDFGKMEGIKLDQENKYVIIRITGFKKIHPIWYIQAQGYLARLVGICTQGSDVKVDQTKCLYNNDPYDEFKISWK